MAEKPKAVRRDLLGLWSRASQAPPQDRETLTTLSQERLDRYFIAFHRLATEGREFLSFAAGVHNGGWYTPSLDFINLPMYENAQLDIKQLYLNSNPHRPTVGSSWPDQQPNSTSTKVVFDTKFKPLPTQGEMDEMTVEQLNQLPNQHLTHQFCWHAKGPFFIWHRPYMMLFEQMLQYYDPAKEEEKVREPLGCHYFAWETSDATSPHPAFFQPKYFIRTNKYPLNNNKVPMGSSIDNPLYRWYAPRSFVDQYKGVFDDLNDNNCTTRDPAFTNHSLPFSMPWRLNDENEKDLDESIVVGTGDHTTKKINVPKRSIEHTIADAMNQEAWHLAGSVEWSPSYSMEEPHNRFHNRFGGTFKGEQSGTLTTNQSPFDPLFWLHHSNVERQLLSWQLRHVKDHKNNSGLISDIRKEEGLLSLYPWATPTAILNTPINASPFDIIRKAIAYAPMVPGNNNGIDNNHEVGTMDDWFYSIDKLPYTYDIWQRSNPIDVSITNNTPNARLLTLKVPVLEDDYDKVTAGSDNYTLFLEFELNGELTTSNHTTSYISAISSKKCASCNINKISIGFDVSMIEPLQDIRKSLDMGDRRYDFSFPIEALDQIKMTLVNSQGDHLGINPSELKLFYSKSILTRLDEATLQETTTRARSNLLPEEKDEMIFDLHTKKDFDAASIPTTPQILHNLADSFSSLNLVMISRDQRVPLDIDIDEKDDGLKDEARRKRDLNGLTLPTLIPQTIKKVIEDAIHIDQTTNQQNYYLFDDTQFQFVKPHIDKLLNGKHIASHIAIVNTPVDTYDDRTWVTEYLPPNSEKTTTMNHLAEKDARLNTTINQASKSHDGILFIYVDVERMIPKRR